MKGNEGQRKIFTKQTITKNIISTYLYIYDININTNAAYTVCTGTYILDQNFSGWKTKTGAVEERQTK